MNESETEQRIEELGLAATRVTPQRIDDVIKSEAYYVFPGTMLTVCCLTLENGFTVIGHSACVSPENFNEKLGQQIARDNAREGIWSLEGYLIKQKLHNEG